MRPEAIEYLRNRRAEFLSRGLCPECGGREPVRHGTKRGASCSARAVERMRATRQRRSEAGLCVDCEAPTVELRCDDCRAYNSEQAKARR